MKKYIGERVFGSNILVINMINVLIHSNRKELDRDLSPVQYDTLYERKIVNGGGNVGNKLFLTASESYLKSSDIYYEYLTDDMTSDYINDKFDIIIWPLANCFNSSKKILGYISNYADQIEKFRIPVLALGGGRTSCFGRRCEGSSGSD